MSEQLSYSVPKAAEVTDIPETKLRQAISDELLKSFRIGRSLRVSEEALRDFIQRLERKEVELVTPPMRKARGALP